MASALIRQDIERHLTTALETDDAAEKDFHIRQAKQMLHARDDRDDAPEPSV